MGPDLGSRFAGASFNNVKFNNRLAYLINVVSVIIILFSCTHYAVRHWFMVNKIIITGDFLHITPVQLSYIAHNKLHGTFFTLDISGLKVEFLEIPWVRQVSLKRHFPHTIEVKLLEYKVLARVGEDALLAENGEVFDGAADDLTLPIFYVDIPHIGLALSKYSQIQLVLKKHSDSLLKLWVNSPRVTSFTTAKNLQVTICAENLSFKLAQLDQYLDKLYVLNPSLTSINLCYKNALAINSPITKPLPGATWSGLVANQVRPGAD